MTEETGAFCNLFGGTPRNRILEFFLEMRGMDYGIGDVAREAGLNRATTYNTMEELLKSGLIIPTRKLGKTQLYSLDLKNSEVQFLIKIFDRVLEHVVASYEEKHHSKKGLILEA
ncbi:MAG TPA: hypothetical protein VJB66_00795 [Candidatus Nanoarchaeia archaeon]|nr:hypothetical protein [Candidatus Nanoarchaeia archaeon]